MAMAIHATRQHQRAGGIHHARPIGELFAEGDNTPILHANIAPRCAEAGRNLSATHYKVKFRHGHPLLLNPLNIHAPGRQARRAARAETGLQQVATRRRFPIQHFTGTKNGLRRRKALNLQVCRQV